jgi:putative ABC transport system substrate-binding protein
MKRRAFIPLAAGLVLAPATTLAQPRMPVVGVLDPANRGDFLSAFRKALSGLGYVEGKNVRLEIRSGNAEALARGAEELVRLKVDVIVARLTPALRAAVRATPDIPIVMAAVGAPVETHMVASLARPGGNVTGMSLGGVSLSAKRLQIMREVVPSLRRLASLVNIHEPYSEIVAATFEQAGKQLSIEAISIPATPELLDTSLAQLERERPDAIHTLASLPAEPIARTALRLHTPLFATQRSVVEAGALMSYGGRLDEQFEGAALYVDKILKGATPASLPVEEPSRFEMYINQKTARALGVTIPPTLMAQADQVIE